MPRNTSSTGRKPGSGSSAKSEETMLRELFIEELKDIYWAEKHQRIKSIRIAVIWMNKNNRG